MIASLKSSSEVNESPSWELEIIIWKSKAALFFQENFSEFGSAKTILFFQLF